METHKTDHKTKCVIKSNLDPGEKSSEGLVKGKLKMGWSLWGRLLRVGGTPAGL